MKGMLIGAALLLVVAAAAAQDKRAPYFTPPPPSEMVHVDGSKNPELIPQWSAWGHAFRVFSGGPRQLPTMVLRHVSKEEAAMVIREADAVQKIDVVCHERIGKVGALLGKEKVSVLEEKVREISLDCRWQTLHARDRVLARLNPEGQAALIAFVESTKAGTSLSIPRKQLARFLEPQ